MEVILAPTMNHPNGPSGIYSITCANGHRYVGSACDLQKRWNHHRHALRHGRHGSSYLQRAWNKYGEGAFVFEVLEECEPEFLVSMEQWWMNMLQPSYNILPTAGSSLGHKPSPETRAKRSATLMGHPVSAETRAKMSAARMGNKNGLGHKHTDETKAKMSAAQKGRTISAEHRAKIGAALRGRSGHRHSLETLAKMSAAQMGNKNCLGHKPSAKNRDALLAAHTGRKNTPETKEKMSQGMRAAWARRRAK